MLKIQPVRRSSACESSAPASSSTKGSNSTASTASMRSGKTICDLELMVYTTTEPEQIGETSLAGKSDALDIAVALMEAWDKQKQMEDDARFALSEDGSKFSDSQMRTYNELKANVFGIGPVKARDLVRQGCTSVHHLRTHLSNFHLIPATKHFLGHYDDLIQPIPRIEIKAHQSYIESIIKEESLDISTELVGSYRRSELTGGDVDLLIWHNDASKSIEVLSSIVFGHLKDALSGNGYLRGTLSGGHPPAGVWMIATACLPGPERLVRKIDIRLINKCDIPGRATRHTGDKHNRRGLSLLKVISDMQNEVRASRSTEDTYDTRGSTKSGPVTSESTSRTHHSVTFDDSIPEWKIFDTLDVEERLPYQRRTDFKNQRMEDAKNHLNKLL